MNIKYLIHKGDRYYPSSEEFDNVSDAIKIFNKIRENRIEDIKCGGDLYFEKDYLCIVIAENDPLELAKEIPPKSEEGD
jgi:hypothetical protein